MLLDYIYPLRLPLTVGGDRVNEGNRKRFSIYTGVLTVQSYRLQATRDIGSTLTHWLGK